MLLALSSFSLPLFTFAYNNDLPANLPYYYYVMQYKCANEILPYIECFIPLPETRIIANWSFQLENCHVSTYHTCMYNYTIMSIHVCVCIIRMCVDMGKAECMWLLTEQFPCQIPGLTHTHTPHPPPPQGQWCGYWVTTIHSCNNSRYVYTSIQIPE